MIARVVSSVRREVFSAYVASAAKVGAWAGVSAILFRADESLFGLFALVRATTSLLNYTSLGLGPALIRELSQARVRAEKGEQEPAGEGASVLSYEAPGRGAFATGYSNGMLLALVAGAIGLALVLAYRATAGWIHVVDPIAVRPVVLLVGLGTLLRVVGDVPGAALQAAGGIERDNYAVAAGEGVWLAVTALLWRIGMPALEAACSAFVTGGAVMLTWRLRLVWEATGIVVPVWSRVDGRALLGLVATGTIIAAAQLADFFYAPANFVVIDRLVGAMALAAYAAAVQVDAALLLLASGVASVMLPRTALAHATGDMAAVRRYYIRGTLVTGAALAAGAAAAWALAPLLLPWWLGKSPVLGVTLEILPLVLVHTVIGGSSWVGRSVLLGMGRAKMFAVAALTAGIANVVLGYCFVRYLDMGLRGIVAATIIAVVVRGGIWTPAYVLWSLKRGPAGEDIHVDPPVPPAPPPAPIA